MKILSIETSCDDTGITIMEATGGITNASFKVLADSSNSQIKIHIPYGGVYPMLAKREHTKNLPILLQRVLKESHFDKTARQDLAVKKKSPVDAIAVTYGPGLEVCLWEGITFAKNLAKKWNVPLIPTNHMEGHIMSVFGKKNPEGKSTSYGAGGKFVITKIATPILSLLVSGGHTQLVLSKKWMQYEIIGESLDDAVGEAYDKVARMLGLPYPGGLEISKLAELERERAGLLLRTSSQRDGARKAIPQQRDMRSEKKQTASEQETEIKLPRPMLHSKNFDFSFSGLKTAVLYLIRDLEKKHSNILQNDKIRSQIALEFENAAIECLIYKTAKAIEKYKIKTVIVGGGVACNTHLQREMKKLLGEKIKFYLPPKGLSGDNSLMIGIAGYLQYIKNKKKVAKIDNIKATGNLRL